MYSPDRTFLRPADGRVLLGLAAALARRTGIDVTWVRGTMVFVALVLLWSTWWALLVIPALYAIGVALVPAESRERGV
jgi:phage shock protein PspC (stress-responsive transcriptional regulator)